MMSISSKAIGAGLLAGLVSCGAPAHADWEPRELDEHVTQTNFVVGEHCTATMISSEHRLLLTNHHCVNMYTDRETETNIGDDGQIEEITRMVSENVPVTQNYYEGFDLLGERTWYTTIVDDNAGQDLALLQIIDPNTPHMSEAEIFTGEAVYRGETVYAVGNSKVVYDASVTKGVISSVNRRLQGLDAEFYYQMDAGILGGNSGGALYNDDGELIGVPTAKLRGSHVGFAVPYTAIQEFLTDNCYAELFDPIAETYEECEGIDAD